MDVALDQYLRSNLAVTGSIVSDANGLLVAAKGDLARNSEIKSGLYTSIARLSQSLPSSDATLTDGVTVVIDTAADKQILVRKVGEYTVTVQSDEAAIAAR